MVVIVIIITMILAMIIIIVDVVGEVTVQKHISYISPRTLPSKSKEIPISQMGSVGI